MFELRTTSKVRVINVGTLTQKDRKADELPGAQLTLQMLLPAASMAMFDGRWPGVLTEVASTRAQGELEGIENESPTTLAQHVKRVPLDYKQTGCQVIIDRGLGRKNSNVELDDVTVHSVSFQPQQSGGVKLTCKIDAPALTDATRGTLSGLKATEIDMTLTGPVVDDSQQQIPGTEGTDPDAKPKGGWPFPKKADKDAERAPDATDAFVAANTTELPPERQVGDVPVTTRRSRAVVPPPGAH